MVNLPTQEGAQPPPVFSIFRCRAQSTLLVAASLRREGIRVTVPSWFERRRLPRSKKVQEFEYPYLPSFLFIDAAQLDHASALGMNPAHKCAPFVINRVVALVDAVALEEIGRSRPQEIKSNTISNGTSCRVIGGPFTGWSVVVSGFDGIYYLTRCQKTMVTLKIPPFLLRLDHI